MIPTRWYLTRQEDYPGYVWLVVEEVADPPARGVTIAVFDRPSARRLLPSLRDGLAQRLARLDQPVAMYDAVEVEGRA